MNMQELMDKLRAGGAPDQWVVIDPQGRVYIGTAQGVAPVLLAQHPLLQPFTPKFPYDNG